jgi:hypothetical protein
MAFEGYIHVLAFDHLKVSLCEQADAGEGSLDFDASPYQAFKGGIGKDSQDVSRNYGLGDAPDSPKSQAMVACFVPVLNIVVNKGKVVYELQRHSRREGVINIAANRLAAKKAKGWAQHFALSCQTRSAVYVYPSHVVTEHVVD